MDDHHPYDHNQLAVPDSFVALCIPPGHERPRQSRATITARYEFCEDLANHLYEFARAQHHDLGITEGAVLARVRSGLESPASGVEGAEVEWVLRRLAELEGWAHDASG